MELTLPHKYTNDVGGGPDCLQCKYFLILYIYIYCVFVCLGAYACLDICVEVRGQLGEYSFQHSGVE